MPPDSTTTGDMNAVPAYLQPVDASEKLYVGNNVNKGMDIVELDKTGIVQRRWTHLPNSTLKEVRVLL